MNFKLSGTIRSTAIRYKDALWTGMFDNFSAVVSSRMSTRTNKHPYPVNPVGRVSAPGSPGEDTGPTMPEPEHEHEHEHENEYEDEEAPAPVSF
jgi:hypothetical protein